MIKSVTYLSEDKKSYELSDESDIQTLDTSVAEGSVARVTGKITAEYELRGGNWVKTAGGSGGGGSVEPLVVHSNVQFGVTTFDKTWQEIYDALSANKPVYYSHVLEKSMVATFVPIGFAYLNSNYVVPVMQQDGTIRQFTSETADGFPSYQSLG